MTINTNQKRSIGLNLNKNPFIKPPSYEGFFYESLGGKLVDNFVMTIGFAFFWKISLESFTKDSILYLNRF